MLIPICAQIFAFVLALLSFINNVEVEQYIELVFLLLGLLPPIIFVIFDYRKMISRVKEVGLLSHNPNPDSIKALEERGRALIESGKHEEALKIYEEGIKRSNGSSSLYFNLGMCLYEGGRYAEAAQAYSNALDINPEVLEIHYYLGAALTEMRQYDDAIEAYKSALRIKPSDGEIYYSLASIYAMLGRYDISIENLQKAIELNGELRNEIKNNDIFSGMQDKKGFTQLIS